MPFRILGVLYVAGVWLEYIELQLGNSSRSGKALYNFLEGWLLRNRLPGPEIPVCDLVHLGAGCEPALLKFQGDANAGHFEKH